MNIYDLIIIRRQLRCLNLDYSALQDVGGKYITNRGYKEL